MMTPEQLESAVVNEFVACYLVDELPRVWDDNTVDEPAEESAERLSEAVGPEGESQLRSLSEAAAGDRKHSQHAKIAAVSEIHWARSDERWQQFQRLLSAVVRHLQ
jgi:hypothetical protein